MTINFGTLTTEQVRLTVRLRGEMLALGYRPNSTLIVELDLIRVAYIERVKLPTYVNHMLGEIGPAPVRDCRLYWPDGSRIEIKFRGPGDQPVEQYIAKRFAWDTLPARVEYDGPRDSGSQGKVRYL